MCFSWSWPVNGYVISHLRVPEGLGTELSSASHRCSAPSCLTSAWHHVCLRSPPSPLPPPQGLARVSVKAMPTPPLPIPCCIPDSLPTWPGCSGPTDRTTATTQQKNNLSPFKSGAVVLSDSRLPRRSRRGGRTANVHTLAWL